MKYEISFLPNFENEKDIVCVVESFPGVETTGKTRSSGYYGCDTPVILDVECNEHTITSLKKIIESVSTDSVSIFYRCPTCGHVERI